MIENKPEPRETLPGSAHSAEVAYRAILDSALDAIITMDAAGRILEFNPAAERIFGFTRAEIIGKELAEMIIPPALREQHRRGLAHYLKTGRGPVLGRRIELNALRHDGSEILVELAISVAQGEGAPLFVAYIRDVSARKKNEDALRRQAELLNQAHDAIIVWDVERGIEFWNRGAERLYGWQSDEVQGRSTHELFQTEGFPPNFEQSLNEGGWTGYLTHTTRDGRRITVESRHTVFRQEGRRLIFETTRDVTARERGEEATRRLGAIIESSDDAIISKDLDGVIKSWNSSAQRLFGYTAEEAIGRPITILIPADRHNEEPDILRRIRRGERIEHYETIRRRKDGKLLNVSLTVSPIKDEDGRVVGVSKIARDITERVRSERRRLAQYTVASLLAGSWTLAEASPPVLQAIAAIGDWALSAIWLCQEDEKTLRCPHIWHETGERWEKFAQFSRSFQFKKGEGLPGRVWQSKKPMWIRDVTVDSNFPRASVAKEVGIRGGFAFPLFAGDAVNGVVELFSQEFAEPDEDLMQLVTALGSQLGLFIERRRVDRELQREKEAAQTANEAKDRFLAMLSHELRTPLTPVMIWAGGALDQPGTDPEMEEGLRMVLRNVELEARLIDDLLSLTRLSRGKLELQLERSDIHELLRNAMEIVRSDVEGRQLKLDVDLAASSHHATVDPPRLQQVFWNLLRNACKFSVEKGVISVRSQNRAPDMIAIEIRDSGTGIDPQFLNKIFEPFEQVDSRREGLGLGLAISKAIVEMHQGSIHAQSEGVGKGANFVIDLPLKS